MDNREMDFYQKLRVKIKEWLQTDDGQDNKWAEYIMLAPDLFHLLIKLTADEEVMIADKARLAAAILYFISPLDIMPEGFLGPIGYTDDIAVAAYVLNAIINHTDPEIVRKHWAGEGEILEVVQRVLASADKMIGSGLWNKLKRKFK
ncbi:MAG: YkvA family protein [Syntrophomonadaceae bacterium]